jgi:hypothetical protein
MRRRSGATFSTSARPLLNKQNGKRQCSSDRSSVFSCSNHFGFLLSAPPRSLCLCGERIGRKYFSAQIGNPRIALDFLGKKPADFFVEIVPTPVLGSFQR